MAKFDFKTLTLGETAFIEDMSGQPIGALEDDSLPKGKGLAALVTIVKRRTGHPDFKFNDALNFPLADVPALLEAAGRDDEAGDASGEAVDGSGESGSD